MNLGLFLLAGLKLLSTTQLLMWDGVENQLLGQGITKMKLN